MNRSQKHPRRPARDDGSRRAQKRGGETDPGLAGNPDLPYGSYGIYGGRDFSGNPRAGVQDVDRTQRGARPEKGRRDSADESAQQRREKARSKEEEAV